MSKKQVIRINQDQLHQMVKESVDRILNPAYPGYKHVNREPNFDTNQTLSKERIQSITYYLNNLSKDITGISKQWNENHSLRDIDYLLGRLDYLVGLIKDNAGM